MNKIMLWESMIAKQMISQTQLKQTHSEKTWIIFNWFNLLDCAEFVAEGNYDDINAVQLDTYNAPRVDWGGVLGYYINWKQIEFKIIIKKDTEEELNSAIDLIKKELAVENGILELKINWEYRRWEANLTWLQFNRDFEKKTIQSNITASFNLTNHLYAEITDAYTESWITSNNLALDINNGGTARCFYKIAFIFGAGNAWVSTIKIEHDWYFLETTQAINDWDIIIIDWVNKEVLYNSNAIDYNWVFTELQTWSNPIQIQIDWTPNVDITTLFNKNML